MPLQDLVTPEKPIPLFVEKCVDFIEDTGRKHMDLQEHLIFFLVTNISYCVLVQLMSWWKKLYLNCIISGVCMPFHFRNGWDVSWPGKTPASFSLLVAFVMSLLPFPPSLQTGQLVRSGISGIWHTGKSVFTVTVFHSNKYTNCNIIKKLLRNYW